MAHVNSLSLGTGASGLGVAVSEIGCLSILGLVLLEMNHVP